nr:MAG TPA: zinc finger domain protein [Caudoviricetes sp.]
MQYCQQIICQICSLLTELERNFDYTLRHSLSST